MKFRYAVMAALMTTCATAAFACCTPVTGAPFSADVVNEINEVLADGNRIHQERHSRFFRDSQGRTREENEIKLPGREPWVQVTIKDPAQQVLIVLDGHQKIARVRHYGPRHVQRPIAPPHEPSADVLAGGRSAEDLGTMQIEGFTATGRRATYTTPAGKMGNEQPIVTVREWWVSPELQETLLTKTVDARSGERIRKLINIQRGDPDPALFQIPPDYAVKNED